MTTTKQYDFLNRLTSVASLPAGANAVSFAYDYNPANQRVRRREGDGSYWRYEYDALGQVRSGRKYWAEGTPVAGQQFEYAFDDIGNRVGTGAGGNEGGTGLRSASYSANLLNQYSSRTVPGAVDVMGMALATNAVTVNGQSVYRKGEYFRKELGVNNNSAPVWTNITVAATGQASVSGNALVPKTPEAFTYDADGNLTSDSLWTNVWNAENRLVLTESAAGVPTGARRREAWTYLPDGRWIERVVSTHNGSSYDPAGTNRFVWDGQVLLAVLDHTNGLVMSFLRGLDLSGSMDGAGGVGGVLAVTFRSNGTHFVCYDGNGNVMALVSAADGSVAARYEYGPFGELIRATGPMAKVNPFRFSTKHQDEETGLVYYGYRYYDPGTGRWVSRDPIAELGGLNLYGFALNDPVDYVDKLGMTCLSCNAVPAQGPDADAGGGGAGHACKTGTLTFTTSQPKAIGSEKDIKKKCNGAAACSYPEYRDSIKCEKCKGCNWKLVVKVKADCKIFYADPTKVNVQFFPDLPAAIKHEQCHCEDWKAAFQQIIDEAGKGEYASKSECEKAKKALDLAKRLEELIAPSMNHELQKYKPGGSCYAYSSW